MYHGETVPGFPGASAPRLRDGDHRAPGPDRPLRFARRRRALRRRRRAVADGRQGHRALGDVPAARRRPRPTRWSCSRSGSTCRRAARWPSRTSRCSGPRTSRASSRSTPTAQATEVAVIAGRLGPVDGEPGAGEPLAPPPDSWAVAGRRRRRDLDDAHGARRALDAAGRGRRRGRAARCISSRARAVSVAGQRSRSTPPSSCAPTRAVELVNGGRRRRRVPAAAGPPDRRAGGAVRPVRDEHRRPRSRQAFADYRRTAVRRLAVARHGAGARPRARALRAPRGRARGKAARVGPSSPAPAG